MKTLRFFTAALLLTLLLCSCGQGVATVSKASLEGAVNRAPGENVESRIQSPATGGDGNGATIYFEQVTGGRVDGIAFLSLAQASFNPLGVYLRFGPLIPDSPLFTPSGAGAAYLYESALGEHSIESVNPDTFRATRVLSMPSRALQLSGTKNGRWLGWADASGAATVYSTDRGTSATVDLRGAAASRVDFGASGALVLAQLKGRRPQTKIFPADDLTSARHTLEGTDAVVSSNGARVAYVRADDRKLAVADLSAPGAPVVTTFGATGESAREPAWNQDGRRIAYWSQTGASKELRVADGATLTTQTVVALTESAAAGIVCPAWLGDELYFGNGNGGSFAIFRARRSGAAWAVSVFARGMSANSGYICPKVGE